jgi:hypothetical protein
MLRLMQKQETILAQKQETIKKLAFWSEAVGK